MRTPTARRRRESFSSSALSRQGTRGLATWHFPEGVWIRKTPRSSHRGRLQNPNAVAFRVDEGCIETDTGDVVRFAGFLAALHLAACRRHLLHGVMDVIDGDHDAR